MEVIPKALAQEKAHLAQLSSGRSDYLSRARPTQPIVRGATALQQVQEVECYAWTGAPSGRAIKRPSRQGATEQQRAEQRLSNKKEGRQRRRREACTWNKDLGAQPAKLSALVPHMVAYLGSNTPQTRENFSHSEVVPGVEATKGSKGEVDHALVSNPGSVAEAEATDQNNGPALKKGKRAAREMRHRGPGCHELKKDADL